MLAAVIASFFIGMVAGGVVFGKGVTGAVTADTNGDQKLKEVSLGDDPVIGDKNAPIAIVEFSDFQCPFCRLAWQGAITELQKNEIASGKVKLVFKDFPLDQNCNAGMSRQLHPQACKSAEAAQCAAEQGKFEEMHDKIFEEQAEASKATGQSTIPYSGDDLKKWASEIGLDTAKFNSCLDSGKYDSEIKSDIEEGAGYGVTGTPAFFIGKVQNGKIVNPIAISGAQPYSVFQQVISQLA